MLFSLDTEEYSPLVLAYIGDAVHELYIRTRLVKSGNVPVNALHVKATKFVSAEAQYQIYHKVKNQFTAEEELVFKKGRNAKSATVPKNADPIHYRHATGFEALLGYLYVKGREDRLYDILNLSFDLRKEDLGV
jgi:ribonuclease-3 family protein